MFRGPIKALKTIVKVLMGLVRVLPRGEDLYLLMTKNRVAISYRGVFPDRASAQSVASERDHYDLINARKADEKAEHEAVLDDWVQYQDYPALFWLGRVVDEHEEELRVLELGGSLGNLFYSAEKFVSYPPQTQWCVAELPEAVALGSEIARGRGETRLSFADSADIAQQPRADVFVTAGTVQYMETSLPEILQSLRELPSHVIVHMLPNHDTEDFWTLQDLRTCEVPYHIHSKSGLREAIAALGYREVDHWDFDREVLIPFHLDKKVDHYSGYYFALDS